MSNPGTADVSRLLAVLRDTPADTSAASDDILGTIYQYLIAVPPGSDGKVHWFCKNASSTTTDAATFLIRLMAYNSAQVTEWKQRLHRCLTYCALCVQGLELAKVTSQDTFLAAFNKPTLEAFFAEFNKWELREVLNDLESGNHASTLSLDQSISSTNLPIGTLYRLVSNWTIFGNPRVLSYLQIRIPSGHLIDWLDYPVPPGLLVLLLADNSELRTWAAASVSNATIIKPNLFVGRYIEAMEVIVRVLKTARDESSHLQPESTSTVIQSLMAHLRFAQPSESWSGFNKILRLIPPEWLKLTIGQSLTLKRTVLNHLHDKDSHFTDVLGCFAFLIKRLAQEIWSGDDVEGPQIPIEAIKENPFYVALLQPPNATVKNLAWIPEYLLTVRGHSVYKDVLEKVMHFLCDEAQQERFREIRPALMTLSTRILHQELQRFRSDNNSTHISVVLNVLETHFSVMLSLAYGKDCNEQDWMSARDSARKLVEFILSADIRSVKDVIHDLSRILGQRKQGTPASTLPTFSFRAQIWKTLYSTVQTPDAIASVVCIVSKAAHIDSLKPTAFTNLSEGDRLLHQVNQAIEALRNGFSPWISSFAEYSASSNAIDILQRSGVGKAVTLLLLSPIQDFQTAGQTLAALAFDVDGRTDCFRVMLQNLPPEALEGILEFLSIFPEYASALPEASSLSAALVRCFADVLEVLCASPDGLLHSHYFLRRNDSTGPASRMPTFWKLLNKALALIYNRAPMWATYIDAPHMVPWMRDALILARDALKQWKVIENASNKWEDASSKPVASEKVSLIGQHMIGDLQIFLPELIKWLRLTDEELLHQSFSLLQSIFNLMKETHIRPSTIALEKLNKLVDGAGSTGKATREQKTRLDHGRLLQLSEVLAHFQEDEKGGYDEIEFVTHSIPPKQPVSDKARPKSGAEIQPYIQGKAHPSKVIIRPEQSKLQFSSTRPSGSKLFTEKDQQKLDSTTAIPSFRKSSATTSVANPLPDPRRPRTTTEPKNEALNRPIQPEEDSNSSDSESDGDEEQGPGTEAFRKSPRPKSPRKPKTAERRQIKTLNIPVKDTFTRNKQAHYNAKRLRPDISGFHRILLSWDYNHSGSVPPGKPISLTPVPDRFDNYDHYFRVFQPLLLMECWAQLQQSKEEMQDSYQCKVESRQYVDDWLDIDISISESVRKEWYLAETDIVLLRYPGREKCLMAKVKSYKAAQAGIQATLRCYIQTGTGDPGLQMTTLWQINKVLSLSTLNREYGALLSLGDNKDISSFILRPSLPKVSEIDPKDLREAMEAYKVNEPQATAILKAMKTQGFALIQGPPGTGKTSTICGLIARFLSKRPRAAVPIVVGKTAPSANTSRNTSSEPASPTARILVCAPSNAAIDELAHRIKDGYTGSQKKSNSLNIVRIGTDQAISASVKDISLDYLVDQKLGHEPSSDIANEIRKIRQELESIKQDRHTKLAELEIICDLVPRRMIESDLKVLLSRRQVLTTKLDSKKDQQQSDSRTRDTLRRKTRSEVLAQADIVCSTLSGAGHDTLESLEFDMIIVDEAAQAIELSSLIPLKYGFSRCVMVGDPQQLPPTVLSQEASRFGYNRSLFVRLQQSQKDAIHLLSIQYRMHPDISRLPSQVFYGGKLLDGPGMMDKTRQPWHTHAKFGTYKFLNVSSGIEEQNGHSMKNLAECNVAVELYNRLRRDFSFVDFDFRVGVVSMYKAQIKALRKLFAERFGNSILTKVDFNTVDGFQGQEKDVIILSCVRAGPGLQSVGFLSDVRRMNVALTRAKSSLFILGNAPTLERSDSTWRQIVQDARSRSALVNVDTNYFSKGITPPTFAEPIPKTNSRSTPTLPVPPLLTPQALKASIEENIPISSSNSVSQDVLPKPVNSSSQNGALQGTKRPADTNGTGDLPSRPRPEPPRKRPKQQTMFIPKKRT